MHVPSDESLDIICQVEGTPEEQEMRDRARKNMAWRKYLAENSFEFSTKGYDTADENVVVPWPQNTRWQSQAEFLMNTLKRDGIKISGPTKVEDDRRAELREMFDQIGLADEFDEDVAETTEFIDVYPTYVVESKVPKAAMAELLGLAIKCKSPNYERALDQQDEQDRLENERNTQEARTYELAGLEPKAKSWRPKATS